MKKLPFIVALTKISAFFTPKERLQSVGFFFLMFLNAGFELLGISLILPFIFLINDPSLIETNPKLAYAYRALGFTEPRSFHIFIGVALIGVYLAKNLTFLVSLWLQTRFTARKKISLGYQLLQSYLRKDYMFHLQKNSNELMRNIASTSKVMDNVWTPLMLLLTEMIVVAFLFSYLLLSHPKVTLFIAFTLGALVVTFYLALKSRISAWSKLTFLHSSQVAKWAHQSFAGVKEIKVLAKENFFLSAFKRHSEIMNNSLLKSQFLGQLPRPMTETLVVIATLATIIALIYTGTDPKTVFPTLILFAMVAFRLLPSANRILSSAILVRDGLTVVDLIYNNRGEIQVMSQRATAPAPAMNDGGAALSFHKRIAVKNLSFVYENTTDAALKQVSFEIQKGESIAFVGHSGAGKTTMADLLLCLLRPTSGTIEIDATALTPANEALWQSKIGFIPQMIFLSDDTIRRNIAFGLQDGEIEESKVWAALEKAQLANFVKKLPQGLDTIVGERGMRISGGQRQRIGIARALYNNPEVLLLDEATSALDNETEQAITSAIQSLHGIKTIIIIAHRLSTVSHCDRLLFFQEGTLLANGNLKTLLEQSPEFKRMARLTQDFS